MLYTCFRSTRTAGHPGRPLTLLLFLAALFPLSPARTAPLPGPNTDVVRATSVGRIQGAVVDAETGRPLAGARVCVEDEGTFAGSGRTTALTDAQGRYSAQAHIGRASNKVDWLRVLTSIPIVLALRPQSALRQSRTILATRLNLRVERDGYAPFVGEVRCSRLD